MGHVILRGILLVSPENDTIVNAERIGVNFRKFPFKDNTISASYVSLKNTYYHLGFRSDDKINLQYIISYFASENEEADTTSGEPITIKVGRVHLNNVHYKMDLKESEGHVTPINGVDIPHMEFKNIHARIKDVVVKGSYIDCRIVKFEAHEKSGFNLRDLSTDVSVSPSHIIANNMELQTDDSRVLVDARLEYPDGWNMDPFCDSVVITANIKPGTNACMKDAGYWAPVLWGINPTFNIEGYFHGPVADMRVDNFIATFGEESTLLLDGHVNGLPDITKTFFDVKVHQFHTTYEDANNAYALEKISIIDKLMRDAELLDLIAEVYGNLEEGSLVADLNTDLGSLNAYAQIRNNTRDYEFQSNIASSGIQLNKILPNEWVSQTGVDLGIKGHGNNMKDLVASVQGELMNTVLQGNELTPTTFNAEMNRGIITFDLSMDDTLADLDLVGNINIKDSVKYYVAELEVNRCNLTKLNIVRDTNQPKDVMVATELRLDAHCKEWSHVNADLSLDNTKIVWNGDNIRLGQIELKVKDDNVRKRIGMTSDIANFSMDGYFNYPNLGLIYQQFVSQYIPIYFANKAPLSEQQLEQMVGDQFSFDLNWTDKKQVVKHMLPQLKIAYGTTIHGNYNYTESLKLVLRSDSIGYGGIQFHDVGVNSSPIGGQYQLKLDAEELQIGNSMISSSTIINASTSKKNANLGIKWGGSSSDLFRGDIAVTMFSDTNINHIHIIKPIFYINNEKWTLRCPEGIQFAKHMLNTKQLAFLGDNHSIDIRTNINGKPNDHIDFSIHNINIQHLVEGFMSNGDVSMEGSLYGNGVLMGVSTEPHLNANIHLADFVLNSYPMGDIDVSAGWESTKKQIELELSSLLETEAETTSPISVTGYVDMHSNTPILNLNAMVDKLNIAAIGPFVKSFSSDIAGQLNGNLKVDGDINHPNINGIVALDHSAITIAPTSVRYSISDSIRIENNLVKFDNFTILDPQSNILNINGNLDCKDLKDIRLNLAINSDKIMLLNNKKSAQYPYYGTLFASTSGNITGNFDKLNIALNAETQPGSEINVTIDDKRQVQNVNFITFVEDKEFGGSSIETTDLMLRQQKSPLHLTLNASITPDVKLNIPITMGQIAMQIGATGQGDLELTLAENMVPTVKGTYEIINGDMILRLMSLVKKNFTIENGSLLEFPGDITSTRFDIKAIYSHRTNLSSLTGSLGSENAQQSVLVESVIALAGTIDQPDIKFDLRLPNADQSVNEEVFAYIDRNNERDMLNQTISLLVLGQFANASTGGGIEQDNINSGYQMVANTIGSAVTSLVKVVNVDFEYKAATSLTTEQFDVDISKSWNKFYFESTFGYGGEANNLSEMEGTSNLVGDMLVGYKLNPRIHLFAFNRTNSDYYTRSELPFKQGLGIKLTRDFNNWSDLFKKRKK